MKLPVSYSLLFALSCSLACAEGSGSDDTFGMTLGSGPGGGSTGDSETSSGTNTDTETNTDTNTGSTGDGDDEGEACGVDQLECAGACVDCPTPSGAAAHTCDDAGACVVETCREGFERCTAGCCTWEFEAISSPPMTGTGWGELALAADSTPYVAHMRVNDEVAVARRGGLDSWSEEVVAVGLRGGERREIAIDSEGTVHVALYDWLTSQVEYHNNAGGVWTEELVEAAAEVQQTGIGLQMVLDDEGFAHMAYYKTQPGRIIYASNREGAWSPESLGEYANSGMQIAVDGSGQAYITHRTNNELHLRWREANVWQDEVIAADVITNLGLAIDDRDRMHAMWGRGFSEIWYALDEGAGWQETLVDDKNQASKGELVVDASGRPHMAYCFNCTDLSAFYHYDDVKYAWFDGEIWRAHIVHDGRYLTHAKIAVDALGLPQVLFLDNPELINNNNLDDRSLMWGWMIPAD